MTLNFNARNYLHAFFSGAEFPDGLTFRGALQTLNLDYSLNSLDRIDAMLDSIRMNIRLTEEEFIQKYANQNFFYFLAFYLGETIRRSTDATLVWYSYEEALAIDAGYEIAGPAFHSSLICQFNSTAPGRGGPDLLPLNAITVRALEDDTKGLRDIAEWSIRRIRKKALTLPTDPGQCFRALSQDERPLAWIPAPEWIQQDYLNNSFDHYRDLYLGGRVVWGRIVQANRALFSPGDSDSPGEVAYDPSGSLDHVDLIAPARSLAALKGTRPTDKALFEFADYLETEFLRAVGMKVPPSISRQPLLVSTVLFHRKHLPDGRLTLPYFPVLINDKFPGVAMVLPSRWWPEELRARWLFNSQIELQTVT